MTDRSALQVKNKILELKSTYRKVSAKFDEGCPGKPTALWPFYTDVRDLILRDTQGGLTVNVSGNDRMSSSDLGIDRSAQEALEVGEIDLSTPCR